MNVTTNLFVKPNYKTMRNPSLSQAALLFALILTQLGCDGDKNSGSGCIEPPRNLSLALPEVDGPLYLKDKPPYFSESFDRIGVGGALSLETIRLHHFVDGPTLGDSSFHGGHLRRRGWRFWYGLVRASWYTARGIEAISPSGDGHFDGSEWDPNWIDDLVQQGGQTCWMAPIWLGLAGSFGAALGCRLGLGSMQRSRRLVVKHRERHKLSEADDLEAVLEFAGVTAMVFRSGDNRNLIRTWMPKSLWVAMPWGCSWAQVRFWFLITSRAGLFSLWWLSDQPNLMAAAAAAALTRWPPTKLISSLKLVGPLSGLGALFGFGLGLLGSRILNKLPGLRAELREDRFWTWLYWVQNDGWVLYPLSS